MYIPKAFAQDCREQQFQFMKAHPLATLVMSIGGAIEANPLPLIINQAQGKPRLQGHIAKANDLWRLIEAAEETAQGLVGMAIFQSEGHYISPHYYPSKQRDPRVVPTWNYQAVHVSGCLRIIHDAERKRELIAAQTREHELKVSPGDPWQLSDAPESYIDKMLNAVVGVELSIERIEAKWKLSQNQSDENRAGVSKALARG